MRVASNYAQQCYSGSVVAGALGCDTFTREQIHFSVQVNGSCPFKGNVCRSNDSNIILDTGFIDSHNDLGINAPPAERFYFRQRYHCAPLETEGRTAIIKGLDSRNYTRYYYGQSSFNKANCTFQTLSDPVEVNHALNGSASNIDYTISVIPSFRFNGSVRRTSHFSPSPELGRDDGDVSLVFLLSNGIHFEKKTSDLWYSATTAAGDLRSPEQESIPSWTMDNSASPLACVRQNQWCTGPLLKDCTMLMAEADAYWAGIDLFRGRDGSPSRYLWFMQYLLVSDATVAINRLGALSLRARFGLSNGIQGPLADNQWHLEVKSWFATMLAHMQNAAVNTATGPVDELKAWKRAPNQTVEYSMCNNQKINSSEYITFSLFGILLVFLIGTIIITVSLLMETVAHWVQKRRKITSFSLLEWSLNDVLQLQRLAHEELGAGDWERGTKMIPITTENTPLATLDASNPLHPRLSPLISEEHNA